MNSPLNSLSCFVHASLPSRTVWVYEDIFYNMETHHDRWVKVKLFGLSCIKDRVPCFEIITHEGYVFSDIPVHMIRLSDPAQTSSSSNVESPVFYALDDLVYNNCLSESFCLYSFDELQSRHAHVYMKRQDRYVLGRYWFSLDFHQDNNWYHAIELDQGQLAFIPSHKIIFSPTREMPTTHIFPSYKKLRLHFTV